ncbi:MULTISPECIES: hypothetical protein [Bradyrhizobium]|uniref:hypothetical protein n=1 Tax=Bradyrhizobium TaxID=374 RepID=UPI0009F5536B|nr:MULTISPECIES: hypothetical protein [Bradyrhizobium]
MLFQLLPLPTLLISLESFRFSLHETYRCLPAAKLEPSNNSEWAIRRLPSNEILIILPQTMAIIVMAGDDLSWKNRPFLGGAVFLFAAAVSCRHVACWHFSDMERCPT